MNFQHCLLSCMLIYYSIFSNVNIYIEFVSINEHHRDSGPGKLCFYDISEDPFNETRRHIKTFKGIMRFAGCLSMLAEVDEVEEVRH